MTNRYMTNGYMTSKQLPHSSFQNSCITNDFTSNLMYAHDAHAVKEMHTPLKATDSKDSQPY